MSLEEAAAALDRLLNGKEKKSAIMVPKLQSSPKTTRETYSKPVCSKWKGNVDKTNDVSN